MFLLSTANNYIIYFSNILLQMFIYIYYKIIIEIMKDLLISRLWIMFIAFGVSIGNISYAF